MFLLRGVVLASASILEKLLFTLSPFLFIQGKGNFFRGGVSEGDFKQSEYPVNGGDYAI